MKKLFFSGLLLAGLFSFQSSSNTSVEKTSNAKESKVLYRKLIVCTYYNDDGLATFGTQCTLVSGQDCPFPGYCE